MSKRNLFVEIDEGLDALAEQRTGKRTLRTHQNNQVRQIITKATGQ